MTLPRILAATLGLAIPTAVHAQDEAALSLEQARALSTEALATRLLGASGRLTAESRVVPGFRPFTQPDRLYGVEFASAPRDAGYAGLCLADVYTVDLAPEAGSMLSRVRGLAVEQRYRSVGANEPLERWTEAYGRDLAARCAKSGPALARGYFRGVFRGSANLPPRYANFAVRAFARARTFTGKIACQDGSEPCSRHIAALRALELYEISLFDVDACAGDPRRFCVSTQIHLGGDQYLKIGITTDVDIFAGPADRFAVSAVALEEQRIVH